MKKEDVDLYLNNIRNAKSQEERIALSREFYKLINDSIAYVDNERSIVTYKNREYIINYLVSTGAISALNTIGAAEIVDLARLTGAIVGKATVKNKETELKKIDTHVEMLLTDPNMLPENPTQEQLDLYDGLLTRSLFKSIESGEPVNDNVISCLNNFFDRLPENKSYKQTIVYKKQILRAIKERDDIKRIAPKLSKEEYEQKISSFKKNIHGEILGFRQYDEIVNEYLTFYGDSVSIEQKSEYLRNIMEYQFSGEIHLSKTYTEYFSKSKSDEDRDVLRSYSKKIIKECFARLYESEEKDIQFTDYENGLLEAYLEKKMIPNPNRNINDFNYLNTPSEIKDSSRLEKDLEFLFDSADVDTIDIAKYIIRLKDTYSRKAPDNPIAKKLYDTIKEMDIYKILEKNLIKLGSKNATVDMVNANGLSVSDCADIALELMLEENYGKATFVIGEIEDSQIKNKKQEERSQYRYSNHGFDFDLSELSTKPDHYKYLSKLLNESGKTIYDSRAIRKMVQLYVDRVDEFKNVGNYDVETIIKYFNTVVTKPDFNLFNEQGVSDILQLAGVRNHRFSSYTIKKGLKEALAKNPNYAISLEDAKTGADSFIAEFANKPIDPSREADFDKFLINLSKIKLESEDTKYVLPREYVDFLIKQTIDPNSLLNIKRDKYTCVAERAVEDFAKLDNVDINGQKGFNYTYKTRDYLGSDRTVGVHFGSVIEAKRDRIKRLFNGDLSPINTVYHENVHMTQKQRLAGLPIDYKEYMMQKESVIRNESPKFYGENYTMMYIEIEARERAAQKTAQYIGGNILPTSTIAVAEALKNDVLDMFSQKYTQLQTEYEKEAEKEATLYEPGMNKKNKEGEIKTINQILDEQTTSTDRADDLKANPGLKYEYDIDGFKRSFNEQIDFAMKPSFRMNLNLMREILKENYRKFPNNTLGVLQAVIQYSKGDKIQIQNDFLEGVIDDHLLIGLDTFKEFIQEHTDSTIENRYNLIAYYNINEVINLYEQGGKLPASLNVPDEQGKTPIDKLKEIKEIMQERVPDIEDSANALHRFEFRNDGTKRSLYEQTSILNQQKVGVTLKIIKECLDANKSIKDEGLIYLSNCFGKNVTDEKKKFYDVFLKENLANHVLRYRDSLQNKSNKSKLDDIDTYKFLKTLKGMTENNNNTFSIFTDPKSSKRLLACLNATLKVIQEKWPDIEKRLEFSQIYYGQNFANIEDAMNFAKINPEHINYGLMRNFIVDDGLVNNDKSLGLLDVALNKFLDVKSSNSEIDFVNGVLQDNIAISVNNFTNELQNNPDLKYIDVCEKYKLIDIYTSFAKKNPKNDLIKGLKVKGRDGKTGIDRLTELQKIMEEKHPNIARDSKEVGRYIRKKDGTLLTFQEQMSVGLSPNNTNIDLKLLKTVIRETETMTQVTSLSALNDITMYRMYANMGTKLVDGSYMPSVAKRSFVDDVYKENIHAYIDSYQARLANAKEMDKEQLLSDYYTASFFIMDYERAGRYFSGYDIGLAERDKNGKLPLDKLKEIRDTLEKMPGLETEYNQYKCKEDGSQRTLTEMIDYARDNSRKIFLPFMQTVIMETDVAKDDKSLGILDSLNKFIHVASEDREVNFINGMISNCLPTCIDNYTNSFEDESRKRTDDDLIAYQNIVTYLNTSKENKQEKGVVGEQTDQQPEQQAEQQTEQEGTGEVKKTITERLEELKSMMEEKWPGIDLDSERLDKKRNKRGLFGQTSVYEQLKKNKVSVEGKKKAAEVEARMAEKKHEIEYDG